LFHIENKFHNHCSPIAYDFRAVSDRCLLDVFFLLCEYLAIRAAAVSH